MKPEKYICKEDSERFGLTKGKKYFALEESFELDGERYIHVRNDFGTNVTVKLSRFIVTY